VVAKQIVLGQPVVTSFEVFQRLLHLDREIIISGGRCAGITAAPAAPQTPAAMAN
jgi:hypothetical protein